MGEKGRGKESTTIHVVDMVGEMTASYLKNFSNSLAVIQQLEIPWLTQWEGRKIQWEDKEKKMGRVADTFSGR